MKGHLHQTAIQVTLVIEQMDLQMGLAVAFDRRPHADVGHAGEHIALYLEGHDEHAAERCVATLELDIGSRRAQLATEFLPMHDPPGDREGPAEQCLGTAQITVGQYLAQPRAADTLAIHLDGGGRLDTEAFGGASLEQEVEVAGAVTAETEIVAHFQVPHAKAFNQCGVDELGRAELAQPTIEGQAQHQINSLLAQQLQFLAQPGQPCGRPIRRKVFTWLRLEDHHAARPAPLGRTFAQTRQDGLMPPVHAVEIADGGDAAPMSGAQVVKTSNQLHTALLA